MRVNAVVADVPVNRKGRHVVYWMIAARRASWSFALDRAIALATELERPLIVLEPLRAGYEWASDRMHAFVLQGMADNARAFAAAGITYFPYVEPEPGAGRGLLAAICKHACIAVTDEQPGFFLPRMIEAAGEQLASIGVPLEQVDGNGILPLRSTDKAYPTASAFRRHVQRTLPAQLQIQPRAKPFAKLAEVVTGAELSVKPWKPASDELLAADPDELAKLPIDHSVPPVAMRGGAKAAAAKLKAFMTGALARYGEDRLAASGLSPYLHFGHISAHEVLDAIVTDADWTPARLAPKPTGSREGWWGLPKQHEGFLDELVTWRELGYGFCFHRKDYSSYAALPAWAQKTLDEHAGDDRPETYTRAQLERSETYDDVWNAAQTQLVETGIIGNYLRMLWGKRILEWSKSPRAALATLTELNNKFAIDGRDPNSYSGILWTLGLFDHAWGPERPIFGTIRYMSSELTRKKLGMPKKITPAGSSRTGRRSP